MIALVTQVPRELWLSRDRPDKDGFRDAVEIMQVMRRRITSNTATGDDMRRYRAACTAAERIAAEHYGAWPSVTVDARALTALLGGIETIHPPAELGAVYHSWSAKTGGAHPLAVLLRDAVTQSAGIVISVRPVADGRVVTLPEATVVAGREDVQQAPQPGLAEAVHALHERTAVPFAHERGGVGRRRTRQACALRGQIVAALQTGGVVPIGMAAPHDVITEVLRELQHASLGQAAVRLVHVDGSEGAPFPIGHWPGPPLAAARSIRLGLMSVRHMKADPTVSAYWFRNRLVSVSDRTLAETEDFCYRDTLARLPELTANGIDHIELLHTGFEPAAIGFYRAVLDYRRQHQLTVTPRYLHGSEVSGTPWLEATTEPEATAHRQPGGTLP